MSFGIKRNSSPGHCFETSFGKNYFVSLIVVKMSEDLDLGRFTPT